MQMWFDVWFCVTCQNIWLPVMLPPCLAGEASAEWPAVLQQLGSLVGGQPDAFLGDIRAMRGSDMEVVVLASGEGAWLMQRWRAFGAHVWLICICNRTAASWHCSGCVAVCPACDAVAARLLSSGNRAPQQSLLPSGH
jgi:hypothetical protein